MHKEIIVWKPLQSSSLQINIEEKICYVTSFSVNCQCCQTYNLQALALLTRVYGKRHFIVSLRNVSKKSG